MRNQKLLILRQLDNKVKPFTYLNSIITPGKGWVHTIRTALNMTLKQLGKRLEISAQAIKGIEEREEKGSITLKSLKEVGDALDMKLVYGFIPKNGTFEDYVDDRAHKVALKIVERSNRNMVLEDQANYAKWLHSSVQELKISLKEKFNKSLWD